MVGMNRWLIRCLGHVPAFPKTEREDLFGMEMMAFIVGLARPRYDIGPKAMEYVIPPAARAKPLSIAVKDRRGFLIWCLEAWGGRKHSKPLPEYLAYQIERRLAQSRASEEMKRAVGEFAKKEKARIKRKLKKEFDPEGIGC